MVIKARMDFKSIEGRTVSMLLKIRMVFMFLKGTMSFMWMGRWVSCR